MTIAIGNIETNIEPFILESLANQNSISKGNIQSIITPALVESMAVGKSTIKGDLFSFNMGDSSLEVFIPASFIIKSDNITIGQDNIFTLEKSVLLAESLVQNDAYFSNDAHWKFVYAVYQTDNGQSNGVRFEIQGNIVTGNFNPSGKAIGGANWRIKNVTIVDYDSGYLKFRRSDLDTEAFDILNVT